MYLIFLDTETTGLNPFKHKILELAYQVFDSQSGKRILSYSSVIAQSEVAWAEADPDSLHFTGFTWEMLLAGKTEQEVSDEVINDFNHLNLRERGGVFICQNPSFDRAFFIQLVPVALQVHFGWPYHWLDLASMYWAVRHLQDPSVQRILTEGDLGKDQIANHFGISPEVHPHRAMNGVNHLIACYRALFQDSI